jgi:hypothetical protein
MKILQDERRTVCATLLSAACGFIALYPIATLANHGEDPGVCGRTTKQLLQACQHEVSDDYRVGVAVCLNLSNATKAKDCLAENRATRAEAVQGCEDSREVRDESCEKLGPKPYDPLINPADFVARIDNPHAPFKPGAWWEYRKRSAEGTERVRVEVLNKHREILGVSTTVVRDRVWLNGEIQEDTVDWLAQDKRGNVWYFGELSQGYEDGMLASLDGSFEAGKDGAKPGLWIKAAPKAGDFYRQEWAPGNAEDVVQVQSVNAPDDVPFRNSKPVLMTRDFSPQAPGGDELKFYVPGVGFVLEIELDSGERLELVDYSR